MWEGSRGPCGFTSAGSSYYKMWTGLNGFDPRNDLVLGYVRIGMHGLHESSYCYFKVYMGTRNLKPFTSAFVELPYRVGNHSLRCTYTKSLVDKMSKICCNLICWFCYLSFRCYLSIYLKKIWSLTVGEQLRFCCCHDMCMCISVCAIVWGCLCRQLMVWQLYLE